MRRFLAVLWILAVLLGSGCALREEPAPSEETAASTPTDPQPVCVSLTAGVRGTIQCLDGRDGRCLAVYRMDTGACKVAVYHLQTGALLGQRTMPDGIYEAELLTDGSVALLNRKTGEAFRYDEKLTQCLRQEPGWGKQWLLEESGELWALDENGAVRCTDLLNGSRQEYQLPGDQEHILIGFGVDRTLIWSAGEEETTAWLDRRTGELTPDLTWNNPALLWQTGSAAVYTGQTELLVWPLDEDEIYLLPDRAGDTLRDLAGRTVLLADDKGYLEILDLWNQTAWRRWEPQCVMTVLTDESLVYAVYANGATDLYRWDYRLDGSSETACACLTVEELETRNRAAAAALRRETGVRIFYGEAGAAFNDPYPSGYLGEAECNPVSIYLALEAVSCFMEGYPPGIFQEMVTEPVTGLELYLSGELSADGDGSVASAYGFSTTMDTTRIVVMNLDLLETRSQSYFEQCLAHEFMHVMEDRIYACIEETGIDYLAYWETFAPEPDAYYYSYFDEDGLEISDPAYTATGEEPGSGQIWFLDSYSRSYPPEDRARILEYLYAGEESMYADMFQEPHIRDKAQYLCAVIRACFPSCAGVETCPWETLVEPVSFSSYAQAVMAYEPLAKG